MSSWSHDSLTWLARRAAVLCAAVAIAIAVCALAGAALGIPGISRLTPGSHGTKPNTAIAVLLLGAAFLAHVLPPRRPRVAVAARVAGWLALVFVAVVGSQWLTGVDLGVDQLLFADPDSGPAPGRIAPLTCVVLLLLAAGVDVDRHASVDGRIVNVLALAPLLVGLFELVGYVGAVRSVTDAAGALRMSLPVAVAIVLLAVSLLHARPSRGGMRLLVSTGSGGVVARRLLPVALGLPIVLNALRSAATGAGLLGERTGDWLFTYLILTTFAYVVLRLGRRLELGDIAREAAEERLRRTALQENERMARVVAAQTAIARGSGDLLETMELVVANAGAMVGADGAVLELPDREDLVYRAVVGTTGGHVGLRIPIASSLAGVALRTGRLQHCLDAETDARVDRDACRRTGTRSMICVPLRHRDAVVGVLKVVARTPGRFDERDERTLELLAELAASAVHRAQDERRLAAHHAVAQALAGDAPAEVALAGALRGIGEALGWAAGAVWLRAAGTLVPEARWTGAQLDAVAVAALTDPEAEARVAGRLEELLQTGSPTWVDDLTARAPVAAPADGQVGSVRAAAAGLRAVVVVPIVLHGEALGVVELAAGERRPHDAAELELLGAIAAQIGQFVERRRAQQRIAEHADHLEAVAELSQQLARTHDHRAARPALVAAIRELAGADQVTLLEPDGAGRIVVTAESGGLLALGFSLDLEADTALAVEVFRAGEGRFVADLLDEPSVSRSVIARTQLQSAHYEPLLRDGAVVGVLVVAMRQRRSCDGDGLGPLMRLLAAEAAGGLALADAVARLDERARTDGLTGVANRRAWDDELPRELSRAQRSGSPVSVAILDLDRFKAYNDTHGHPAGDRLLRAAAAGWASRLRATDLLARYGGEEFAVVLPGCDAAAAALVAEDLRAAVPGDATCSVGVATWDGDEPAEALVARADIALYRAKDDGRDRVAVASS